MSRKAKFAAKPLIFGNFYHLIDCLMLFGASIEPRGDGSYRLRMLRQKRKHAAMAWAIIVAESQDPLFDFLVFRFNVDGKDQILAQTRSSRFLADAYERWYKTETLKMPEDMDAKLDARAILFWVLGSWTHAGVTRLPLLGAGTGEAERLKYRVSKLLNWNPVIGAEGASMTLVLSMRPLVTKWVLSFGVPAKVLGDES